MSDPGRPLLLAVHMTREAIGTDWDAMRRAWESSARAVMPGTDIEVLEVDSAYPWGRPGAEVAPPDSIAGAQALSPRCRAISSTALHVARRVLELERPVAVCDLDLLFLRPILDVFDRAGWDLAVTTRPGIQMGINAGLWFLRPTASGRRFLARWIVQHERMLAAPAAYADAVKRYGPGDQAALVLALAGARADGQPLELLELPCREYNATWYDWAYIGPECRVVHVMSQLRRVALGAEVPDSDHLATLAQRWRQAAAGQPRPLAPGEHPHHLPQESAA